MQLRSRVSSDIRWEMDFGFSAALGGDVFAAVEEGGGLDWRGSQGCRNGDAMLSRPASRNARRHGRGDIRRPGGVPEALGNEAFKFDGAHFTAILLGL